MSRGTGGEREGFLHRIQAAFSFSCPLCVLAVLVAMTLAAMSVGAILLDHARAIQQGELVATREADLGALRTSLLLSAADRMLHEAAALQAAPQATASARSGALDAGLSRLRAVEPRILALYILGPDAGPLAASLAPAWHAANLASACLHAGRADSGQVLLKSITTPIASDGTSEPALCMMRGTEGGAVLAVLGSGLVAAQYADLNLGRHGAAILEDGAGRTLLAISAGGDAALAAPSGGLSATRRIEAPVPAILRVSLARSDMLAVWWSRASLIGSSALIVISFLALSILAVRRTEQRELRRLEQMVLPREHIADRERLLAAVATIACDLADCELLDTGQASQIQRPPGQAPPEEGRGIALALLRPDLVRIGPLLLQHRHAARFSATDLAFLRVLAEFARRTVAQQDAVAAAHREAGQALAERDSERAAQQAVQSEMSDASFTLDGDWRIVATNRNADRLLGEYADDLRHRTLWKVFPELVGTVFESQCRRALQDQHPVAFEMRWLRSESWIAVHAYPRAPGLAVYMQDISRQIGIDDRLREAAKMDAIGNLTGGIAHDFNNLLTVILGNIEILDLELPERGEIRDMHEQIRRAAQTATELTHQLLAFARRQPLSPADVDIGRLMIGLDGLLRRTLGATVTVDIRVPEGLWHARIDAAQLEAALVNLALNARDAMPGGGRFTLEAANLALRNPQTDAFGEIRPGNYVVISAADTGAGIPRDVIGRVFEPFFSTKPSGRGTGLGLSMVYGFVTQSGGHARIASEPGRGAVVRLYLPRAAGKPAAGGGGGLPYADPPRTSPPFAGPSTPTYSIPSAPIPSSAGPSSAGPSYPGPSAMGTFNSGPSQAGARAAPAPPRRAEPPPVSTGGQGLPGGAERILVVEDSDMVRDYAQAVLGGLGYAVTVAADGPEALALLDRGLCPELLLTDVLLPNGLDGLQLAEKVLARMPGLPVLYMSGYIENVDAYQSRLDPQTNLLLKPFRRASLAIMVRARLDAARRAR